MADFIHPKNEVPEPEETAKAIEHVSSSRPAYGAPARPASPYQVQPVQPGQAATPAVKRQIVCFSFYKVLPEWRRLPAEEKARHKAEFAVVLTRWNKPGEFRSLTY